MKLHLPILSFTLLLPLLSLNAQTTCYSKEVEHISELYSFKLKKDYEKVQEKFIYVREKEKGQVILNLPDSGQYIIVLIAEKAASINGANVFLEDKPLKITENQPEKNVLKIELKEVAKGKYTVEASLSRNSGFDSCTGFYLFRKR